MRIYKPENLHEELDAAVRDYVRASVGMTEKGKLLIPKLVYNYARDFVEDIALMDWVRNHLPASQVAALHERMHQHEQRRRRRLLNNSPTFAIVPFNFKFRYLFPAVAGKTSPTRNNSFASCIDKRRVLPYTWQQNLLKQSTMLPLRRIITATKTFQRSANCLSSQRLLIP